MEQLKELFFYLSTLPMIYKLTIIASLLYPIYITLVYTYSLWKRLYLWIKGKDF